MIFSPVSINFTNPPAEAAKTIPIAEDPPSSFSPAFNTSAVATPYLSPPPSQKWCKLTNQSHKKLNLSHFQLKEGKKGNGKERK